MRPGFLICAILLLTACATSPTFTPTSCLVRVGVVNSNSGVFANSGRELLRGYEMARDDLNARGGIQTCLVELLVQDDQSDPAQAKRATQALMREPIVALLGSTTTDLTLPLAAVASAQHIPIIPPTASSDVLTTAFGSIVRLAAAQSQMVGTEFEFLAQLPRPQRPRSVGILYENSESGRGIFVAVERAAHDHAIALLAAEEYAPGATDWRASLERIRRTNPDVVYLDTNHLAQPVALLSQVRDLGFKFKFIFVSTLPDALQTDPRAENVLTSVQWLAMMDWHAENGETVSAWAHRFEERYGAPANVKSVAAYESLNLVEHALRQVAPTPTEFSDPRSLRPALLRALYRTRADNTLFGPIRFDDFGQNAHPVLIIQVQKGEPVVVYPVDYRIRDQVIPNE